MSVISQPQVFSKYTSLAGSSEQVIPGFITSPQADQIVSNTFKVTASGTIVAHGATQTVKVALLWAAISASGVIGVPVDTFTPVASGTLIAGTSYDFVIEQEFYAGSAAQGTIVPLGLPTVFVGGVAVNVTTGLPSPLACPNISSFVQAATNNGIVVTENNLPPIAFALSIANSVSDTAETVQINQFYLSQN
jgi:hypothetical protein